MDWFKTTQGAEASYRMIIASDWAPIWSYEALMRRDPAAVYGDLLPVFRESDLNVVNVECVLGDAGAPIPKAGPCLKGDAGVALAALKAASFHVATLANNHAMDYGPESLEATIKTLEGAGIATVGAGMEVAQVVRPHIISRGTGRAPIAIVNFGEGEACASRDGRPGVQVYDLEVQEQQIRALKRDGYIVIGIFHGGREHAVMPPPYVVAGLRRLAEAGADAILAHHPHVPQAVEIHQGVPIAYSLGNFVFRREDPPYYQSIGYLVRLDIGDDCVHAANLIPYKLEENGVFSLKGPERDQFLEDLKTLSSHLASPEKIEALWNAFVDDSGFFHGIRKEFVDAEHAILGKMGEPFHLYASEPRKAISYFDHYFFCPAHREYFTTAFKRLKLGTLGDAPDWALKWVRQWKETA